MAARGAGSGNLRGDGLLRPGRSSAFPKEFIAALFEFTDPLLEALDGDLVLFSHGLLEDEYRQRYSDEHGAEPENESHPGLPGQGRKPASIIEERILLCNGKARRPGGHHGCAEGS